MLALISGVSGTTLAMARDRHLPHHLATVHPRFKVPHRAGPEPGEGVNPLVVQAMAEVGIDLTGRTTRHLTEHTVAASDIVVTTSGAMPAPPCPDSGTRMAGGRCRGPGPGRRARHTRRRPRPRRTPRHPPHVPG